MIPKAVIFDLDGTLIDSMGIWAEIDHQFLERRGITAPDDIFEDIEGGNSFIEVAEHFKKKFDLQDSIEDIMSEWTEMVLDKYQNSIKLKKNVRDFLEFLQNRSIKIAVGTSNNLQLTNSVLKANAIEHIFSAIVTGDDNLRGKPYPDIFLSAAKKLNVQPEYCLVIEDVLVGVQAAKNAGMNVFVIEDEHSAKDKDKILKLTTNLFSDFALMQKKLETEINKE